MTSNRIVIMLVVMVFPITIATIAYAQQPPSPEPGERVDDTPLVDLDLSALAKPPKPDESTYLSEDEIKGPRLSLTVICLGYRPAPIIYNDKNGMPRETYRNPLEYAPTQFKVKTIKKKMINVISQQNQISASSIVPKNAEIPLYYVLPEGGGEDPKKRLKFVGNIIPTSEMTHALVVITKKASAKLWSSPELKVIDISPSKLPENSVLVVNTASSAARYVIKGSKPVMVSAGNVSRNIADPEENLTGSTMFKLDSQIRNGWFQWYLTSARLNKGQRLIIVSWSVPKKVHPTGSQFTFFKHVATKLPAPKKITK